WVCFHPRIVKFTQTFQCRQLLKTAWVQVPTLHPKNTGSLKPLFSGSLKHIPYRLPNFSASQNAIIAHLSTTL
ncbi:hypothetical protein, partial [Kingella kingae]|uniref:hypothetical protein n=2 Tax=Kingella kingae TaxID=504 RepID=UPI001E6326E3